jgi:N-acetylmuramoyl-L-alanine amidase
MKSLPSFKKIKSKKPKGLLFGLVLIATIGFVLYQISMTNSSEKNNPVTEISELFQLREAEPDKGIVCLDPGHGGNDVGAEYKNIYEANINLEVAKKVKEILEADKYRVYLTRSDDSTVEKRDRAKYCNSIKANILVSIHHNSYETDRTVDYSTALYYKNEDQLLASSILASTSSQLDITSQGIAKFNNSLLWVAEMPATLSEGFFMSNKTEYSSLTIKNSDRLDQEAIGIAKGITNYFTSPDQIQIAIGEEPLVIDRNDLEN